jgi:NADPH2:quinone reductase
MRWEDIEVPPPGPGEARIRHTAIAVNFSDINVRRGGFYPVKPADMPLVIGNEAAGVVAALGAGVTDIGVGDRVAYAGMHGSFYSQTGAYAEERNVPADRLVKVPDGVSDEEAGSMMVKGLTAALIINRIRRPQPGEPVLVHAAASGVGGLLVQWSKHLGATVIGTAGSPGKAARAEALGCAHTVLYRDVDFVPAVKKLTDGVGVAVVFDGVGKDTFVRSIDCTRPFGLLVNYGNASGHVPPIDLIDLATKGSLSVCRPGLHYYIGDTASLRAGAAEIFELAAAGVLDVKPSRSYALKDAAEAHRDVEAGRALGALVLIP